MSNDPIVGKTLRFEFSDGPMANKTFEHRFGDDGTVEFHMLGGDAKPGASKEGEAKPAIKYEVAPIREDVYAVAYLSRGYTLTTILDFKTKKLVAFSSNEKMLSTQRGRFESVESDVKAPAGASGSVSRHTVS